MQVVDLGLGHLFHRAEAVTSGFACCVDLICQRLPLFTLGCQQTVDSSKVGLVEQCIDDAVLAALGHAGHGVVQVGEDVIQPTHVALRVIDFEP